MADLNFLTSFLRGTYGSVPAVYNQTFPLLQTDLTASLALALDCGQTVPLNESDCKNAIIDSDLLDLTGVSFQCVSFPKIMDISVGLNQFSGVNRLVQTPNYQTESGFALIYSCMKKDSSQNYWSLYRQLLEEDSIIEQEKAIFGDRGGFAFFVFN